MGWLIWDDVAKFVNDLQKLDETNWVDFHLQLLIAMMTSQDFGEEGQGLSFLIKLGEESVGH